MGNSTSRNDPKKKSDKLELSGQGTDDPELLTKSSNFRQISAWSLGSLSGRLNWSFRGTTRSLNSSHRNRNKSSPKSFKTSSLRNSKTNWPTPLTESIFISHFKRTSRNEEFHIEEVIAKGAFGIVFQVIDKKNTKFLYALKVLKKSKIIDDNSVQQIKDEVDIQNLCGHHQFIVKQIDSWQNKRNLHILFEYIPGGELFTKICTFSIELVRLYIAEIGLALDFLHNAGIINRDVKPENILLTYDYHIKLTDFGLSKWLKFGEKTKTMCGTFQYMAPEILRGEAYGHAVDWWALGIVACRMFVNAYPNIKVYLDNSLPSVDEGQETTDSVIALVKDNQNDDNEIKSFLPPEVNNIPNECRDILMRLLEFNPKLRLKSILAMQRIAFYKNYKIDVKSVMMINPSDFLQNSNISNEVMDGIHNTTSAQHVFHDF